MSEIERLIVLRDNLRLNQQDFGQKIGLSKASISALEGGTRKITERHIKLICSEFNVSEKWLRTGQGSMFIQDEWDIHGMINQMSDLDREAIRAYMSIDPDIRRKAIEQFVRAFSGRDEEAVAQEEIERDVEEYRRERQFEKSSQTSSASQENIETA